MQISPSGGSSFQSSSSFGKPAELGTAQPGLGSDHLQSLGERVEQGGGELQEKFQDFVGQTFFAEMIKSLRTSQKGSAYFNGGRAEEIFQGQFDQQMAEHLSDASAKTIADPMFELFQLGRTR